MHTIFVGDKRIVLTDTVEVEDGFKNYLLKTVKLGKLIRVLNKTNLQEARLIHHNTDKLLKKFLKKLPNVVAGGGKVLNAKGETLFIYRNDKWDLPKGKAEKKEAIEDAAIREVEEETGVENLKITKPLDITYHIFKRNGNHKIKVTHWFEMTTDYEGDLKPEVKENITKAEWLNQNEMEKALENSYANIQNLI